ncbi:MAG: choice-of-anchor J domain-containing protein, partial [Bacteroidales bacterium]|nr:choice-of-anchor J domain-containing protein [Bacteroidales bacterium]
SSSNDACVNDMYIDAGDIYVCGWEGSTLKVWKNGSVLHSHTVSGSCNINSVVANTAGVYYAGKMGGTSKIWKDGSVKYSPTSCENIIKMYVNEPTCASTSVRSLPFYESFENGATSWACWEKRDIDKYNKWQTSYWHRRGEREITVPTGKHTACHGFLSDSIQEGWLISPKLAIKSTSNVVTLTFKTYESAPDDYRYEGVWVSKTTNATSSFQEVCKQTSPSLSWKTVTVDLSAYKGQNIYIAFKYKGKNGHIWYIDDVNVTEKNTTAIEDAEATNAQVSVYPNPAKNMLYVNGLTETNVKAVEIYDMTGRKVKQQPVTENMSIDIADLAKGVYVLSAGYQKIKFVKE